MCPSNGNSRASPFERAATLAIVSHGGGRWGRALRFPAQAICPATHWGVAMAAFGSAGAGAMPCARPAQAKAHSIPTARQRHLGERRSGGTSNRPMLAPWQVRLAMRTMHSNLGSPISISEVASLCRLSLCYFVRAFTNTVGIAPYAWFVQQRVIWAKNLLAETALPLVQIALECGFSDQPHFTKAFAKASGITPAKWRRQIRTCTSSATVVSKSLIPSCRPALLEQPHGDWRRRAGQGRVQADSTARNHVGLPHLQGA